MKPFLKNALFVLVCFGSALATTYLVTGQKEFTDAVTFDGAVTLKSTCSGCTATGVVSTTGSPASGNLAKFSGAATLTNGDLAGDCTTSGTLTVTCTKTNGNNLVYPSGFYLTDGTNYYAGPTMFLATLPSTGNYSWVNQGSFTDTATGNGIILTGSPTGSGDNLRQRVKSISTDTSLTAMMNCSAEALDFRHCGVEFRESGTSKITGITILYQTTSALRTNVFVGSWTNSTTFGSTIYSAACGCGSGPVWFKLTVSGSNLLYAYSFDGNSFIQVASEAKTARFTTAPDQWGYFLDLGNSGSTNPAYLTLLSWKTT